MAVRLGLVGIGKIARDQHLTALAADSYFDLSATASREGSVAGIPAYPSIEAMLAAEPNLEAVSLCTPPLGRVEQAAAAIAAGLHVMLEKPPAATPEQAKSLAALADARGVTLFTAWHSREAAGVAPARAWLTDKRIARVRIDWKEDIRRWHPGQDWILAEGGFGVFDPGINALSIVTEILPEPVELCAAAIGIPENRASPLTARLTMQSGAAPIAADFDFLQTGPQTWDIHVDTDAGTLTLSMGGSVLCLPGAAEQRAPDREYRRLYARFAACIANRTSHADVRPLALVADALRIADRAILEPFTF